MFIKSMHIHINYQPIFRRRTSFWESKATASGNVCGRVKPLLLHIDTVVAHQMTYSIHTYTYLNAN